MSAPVDALAEWFGLAGRVAVVTGAGANGGIGHAIALALAQAGADVFVSDVDAEGAAETAREVAGARPAGGRRAARDLGRARRHPGHDGRGRPGLRRASTSW